jgi:hypothetical protein
MGLLLGFESTGEVGAHGHRVSRQFGVSAVRAASAFSPDRA